MLEPLFPQNWMTFAKSYKSDVNTYEKILHATVLFENFRTFLNSYFSVKPEHVECKAFIILKHFDHYKSSYSENLLQSFRQSHEHNDSNKFINFWQNQTKSCRYCVGEGTFKFVLTFNFTFNITVLKFIPYQTVHVTLNYDDLKFVLF